MKNLVMFLPLALLLVGCATAPAPKYPTLPADLQATYEEAEHIYRESHADRFELAKAQDLYIQVLRQYPKHAPSILGIGKIASRLGYINGYANYEPEFVNLSLKFIDRALEIDPNYSAALANKASAYNYLNDLPKAAEWLEKAKRANPNDPRVWDAMTIFYLQKQDYQSALDAAEKGLQIAKKDYETQNFLGLKAEIYGFTRQFDLMIQARLELAKQKPTDHWIAGNVAYSYTLSGDWAKCTEWAEKALNLLNYSSARYSYSYCSIQQGNFDQALNMKWQAPFVQFSNKKILTEKEFYSKFSPTVDQAPEKVFKNLYLDYVSSEKMAIQPADRETATKYHSISFYLANQKKFAESLPWLEKATKLDPTNFGVLDDRIRTIIYGLQDKPNGYKLIEESLRMKRTPKETAKLMIYKAQLLCSEKKTEACASVAEEALLIDPTNEYGYSYVYGSYIDNLKKPEKVIPFQQKMEKNEDNLTPSYLQWKAYFTIIHLKDYIKAEELLRRAIKLDSNYAMAYYRLAFVHYERQERKAALENINLAIQKGIPNKFVGYAGILKGNLLYVTGYESRDEQLMKEAMNTYAEISKLEPDNQGAKDGYLLAKRALASIQGK